MLYVTSAGVSWLFFALCTSIEILERTLIFTERKIYSYFVWGINSTRMDGFYILSVLIYERGMLFLYIVYICICVYVYLRISYTLHIYPIHCRMEGRAEEPGFKKDRS